ncbi:hypothetical protein [Streptomyces sp. TRM70350]|uniref:hypothetical protein n=1 Tax=Streptomyces sp. TRM70350 TaxID=2856165 RepID=UPI001C44B544|nr:hypothetical protein [Streptomyces sp. TRM70350]MBV7695652.1 hypothetical protein [Streptomyces sp. TRM70350]
MHSVAGQVFVLQVAVVLLLVIAAVTALVLQARKDSGVAYIIAFDTKGIRWTHPDPNLIGKPVVGSYAEALAGRVHQETYDTPGVGRAVDTMVPVFDTDGKSSDRSPSASRSGASTSG